MTAIIKIPKGIDGLDCQTNGVPIAQIINALDILQKHFARQMIEEAKKALGENHTEKELSDYLQTMLDTDMTDFNKLFKL